MAWSNISNTEVTVFFGEVSQVGASWTPKVVTSNWSTGQFTMACQVWVLAETFACNFLEFGEHEIKSLVVPKLSFM